MEMSAAQEMVEQFCRAEGLEAPAPSRLLDLVSEVGELSKEMSTGTRYGREAFRPTPAWGDEMGDVIFATVGLANTTGVDLESALLNALDKYRQRLAARGDAGSE